MDAYVRVYYCSIGRFSYKYTRIYSYILRTLVKLAESRAALPARWLRHARVRRASTRAPARSRALVRAAARVLTAGAERAHLSHVEPSGQHGQPGVRLRRPNHCAPERHRHSISHGMCAALRMGHRPSAPSLTLHSLKNWHSRSVMLVRNLLNYRTFFTNKI